MSIQAHWINDGSYLIQDEDYGFMLCRLSFSLELIDRLGEQQLAIMANDIKRLVVRKLKEIDTETEPEDG